MISTSLGILALFAGARGYPFLLLAAGCIVLAHSCFSTGGPSVVSREEPVSGASFALPPVPDCPPERLREARTLAARVAQAANEARSAGTDSRAHAPGTAAGEGRRVLADATGPPAVGSSPRRRPAIE